MLNYNKFDLYLIRHGQSITNQNPDLIGQKSDVELSETGKEQAWHLGERLAAAQCKFDFVFASPYTRAHDTAKIVLKHFKDPPSIKLVDELREYSAGDWTGLSRKQIITKEVLLEMGFMNNAFLPPNGESMHMVSRRVSKWLEERILYNKEIMEEAFRRKENDEKAIKIACFSHGMTIKCLLNHIMRFDSSFTWRIDIENTSISKLAFDTKGWRLNSINDHSHIL